MPFDVLPPFSLSERRQPYGPPNLYACYNSRPLLKFVDISQFRLKSETIMDVSMKTIPGYPSGNEKNGESRGGIRCVYDTTEPDTTPTHTSPLVSETLTSMVPLAKANVNSGGRAMRTFPNLLYIFMLLPIEAMKCRFC